LPVDLPALPDLPASSRVPILSRSRNAEPEFAVPLDYQPSGQMKTETAIASIACADSP
jgi:hypothetical protein